MHIITGLEDGGAEGALFRLVMFSKDKINHTVISLTDGGKYKSILEPLGVDVHCLNLNARNFLFKFFSLILLIKKCRPDAIQTWLYHADLFGGCASRVAGYKNIFWGLRQADFDIKKVHFSTKLVIKLCAKLSSIIPKSHVTCATAAIRSHQKVGYSGKFEVVPNGYDLSKFTCQADSRIDLFANRITKNQMIFGMVARFDAAKDHENLLRAFSMYLQETGADSKLVLVGKNCDEDNNKLKAWLAKYGLMNRVILFGQCTNIPQLMSSLDLHVLSSEYEGFPNVVAEAMACGIPCISTDVGDARLIIEDNGWIVPPKNAQALASAMQLASELQDDADSWAELKKRCRNSVSEKYSIEKMSDKFSNIWFG